MEDAGEVLRRRCQGFLAGGEERQEQKDGQGHLLLNILSMIQARWRALNSSSGFLPSLRNKGTQITPS